MLSDSEIDALAEQHIKNTYPRDTIILSREVYAHPDGVYFTVGRRYNARHPLLERHAQYIGGFFVSRRSGQIWTIGSGHINSQGLQFWLEFYDEGWRDGLYRMVVREVPRPLRLANLLLKSRVSYAVLELEHGVVWNRRVQYDKNTLLRRFKQLPCSFEINGVDLRAIIPALESGRVALIDYSYVGHPIYYDWHPEHYSADQLDLSGTNLRSLSG
jgi:hypothetical protein